MHIAIEVERISPDELRRSTWGFIALQNLDMTLDHVTRFERPSKRHGWRRKEGWSRLNHRRSDISREDPPDDVKAEVVRRLTESIRFC